MEETRSRTVDLCLLAIALALLVIGLVTGTLLRHTIQVLPLLAAALLGRRDRVDGAAAALPLFLFWAIVMVLIWLYVWRAIGPARGSYSTLEIVLTVAMAVAASTGGTAAFRELRGRFAGRALLYVALFGAAQLALMWVSFRPPVALD